VKKGGSQKEKLLMDASMEAKMSPEVKPWVRWVVEAEGVLMSANADGERRLGWWGVEMALRFFVPCCC
jgi:hypothetical protein